MKLKNKILILLVSLLGFTTTLILKDEKYINAIAYTNNNSSFTNKDGNELTDIKMLVDIQSIMIDEYSYKSIKIKESSSNYFSKENDYKLTLKIAKSSINNLSIQLYNSTNKLLGNASFTYSEIATINESNLSVNYELTLIANLSVSEDFYIVINDSTTSYQTALSEYTFNLIKIETIDTKAPVIDGYSGVYYTNYDNPISLKAFLEKISAYDEVVGEVPIKVEEDNYTSREKVLGDHYVKISASDGTNTSEITINIIVVDATSPTIKGETKVISKMSNPITEDSIRKSLIVSDNYDLNLEIELVSDNYSGNENKLGSYLISYIARDSSNNVSEVFVVEVETSDDVAPYFYISKEIISVEDTIRLTHEEILETLLLQTGINKDEITEYTITSDYFESYNIASTYSVIAFIKMDNGEVREIEGNIEVLSSNELDVDTNSDYTNSNTSKYLKAFKTSLSILIILLFGIRTITILKIKNNN